MMLFLVVILILIVGGLIAFFASAKQVRNTNIIEEFPTLSFDSQALYRPVRSLARSIQQTSESSEDPAVRAMASTVSQEVQQAHDHVVQALQTRDRLRKAMEGHINVEGEVERFKRLRDEAESPQEKLSYTKALEAKLNEFNEYQKAKDILKKIENEVELTKASLSELKTKLAVSDATTNAADRAEDLRSSLGSLETISSSIDEAEAVLRA